MSGCIEEIENKPPEESIYYYTETGGFNQTHASIVWNKISGSDEAKFVTSERYYSAVIFMHPYTVEFLILPQQNGSLQYPQFLKRMKKQK